MLIDLSGKRVLVTGAARGIGSVLARRFAEERCTVVLVDRDTAALGQTAAAIGEAGARPLMIECDVSDAEAATKAVETMVRETGGIDVLVNNAGICPGGTVESFPVEAWDETFAVNCRGVFLFAQAAIPHMKRAKYGRIINAASFAAILPSCTFSAYAASKAAVVSFTRVLAAELGPWNITVNSYAPGMVPSGMNDFAEATGDRKKRLLDTLTLRRWGSPEDLAALLIFLASDMAAYITGACVEITGGKFTVQFPQAAYEIAAADVTSGTGR